MLFQVRGLNIIYCCSLTVGLIQCASMNCICEYKEIKAQANLSFTALGYLDLIFTSN